MKNKVDKILAYGYDIFIHRLLIFNYPKQLMADNEIEKSEIFKKAC